MSDLIGIYLAVVNLRWLTVFGLAGVIYGLPVTQDYRKRRRFYDQTAHMSDDELRAQFAVCLHVLAAFMRRELPGPRPDRSANNALVMATVLRERICGNARAFPMPKYLRSRRQVWKLAKTLSKDSQIPERKT